MALNSGTEPSSVCTFYALFCIGEIESDQHESQAKICITSMF